MSKARKARRQEPEGFEEFWSLWLASKPRPTDGRGKAREAYAQWLEEGFDSRDIIDGARWFIRSFPENDKPFFPLASSWLNSERWRDDCEKERAFQARQSEPQKVVSIHAPKSRFLQQYEGRE